MKATGTMERQYHRAPESFGLTLSREQVKRYLENLKLLGYSAGTLDGYRRALEKLYLFLPEDKYMKAGILERWQDSMLERGYSVNTVNNYTAAANGLLLYLGHRELQASRVPDQEESSRPELTRTEYLRLLSAARTLEKKRVYLLVKIFGSAGLSVSELKELTAEAVQKGELVLPMETLKLPAGLREELLDYMKEENITTGHLFLTKDGRPQDRTTVTAMIQTLCQSAQVPEKKATPRCLKKLYQSTWARIREDHSFLLIQVYENLLDTEQKVIGWEK